MSTDFKEFLHEQAEKHQAEARAGKAMIDEWRASIKRLLDQIRAWLKDSDPQGLIEIKESEVEVREPGLGLYSVPRLDLRVFGKWVGVIPKARKTVATAKPAQKLAPERATGRVDITDELRRYVLYRFQEGDQAVWMIDERLVDEDQEGRGFQYIRRPEPKPFDQEAFEKALMTYLR
jgi:hypothetical protein